MWDFAGMNNNIAELEVTVLTLGLPAGVSGGEPCAEHLLLNCLLL